MQDKGTGPLGNVQINFNGAERMASLRAYAKRLARVARRDVRLARLRVRTMREGKKGSYFSTVVSEKLQEVKKEGQVWRWSTTIYLNFRRLRNQESIMEAMCHELAHAAPLGGSFEEDMNKWEEVLKGA